MAKKLSPDKWLFAATIGLALFGVVMVYSASAMIAQQENGSQFYYLVKQAVWVVIGIGVMFLAMQFNYQQLKNKRIVYGLLVISIITLMAVFGFSSSNGAHRWLKLRAFSVQPSELSKIALAIFLAYYLEKRAGDEGDFWRTFVPCGFVTAILAGLIIIEPDLGTALMLALIFTVVIFTAGARLLHLGIVAAPALLGVIGLLIFVPWRLKRMSVFLDPWSDPQGGGFQVIQSLLAVASGGTNGLGFAQGKQKMLFLPFAHSDFIFAVVGEELGLLGCLAIVAMFALFLWRGIRTALLAPDRFGMLLSLGIVTSIVAQAMFNISVVLALVPTKGIPLPLISYGGSSLVPTLAAIGILLNVSQHATGSLSSGLLDSVKSNKRDRDRIGVATTRGATPTRVY